MGHRRHAVFAGVPAALEALRRIGAVGGVVAGAAGGDRPGVAVLAVDDDAHGLGALVDPDDDGGGGLGGPDEQADDQCGQAMDDAHGFPLRRDTNRRSLAGLTTSRFRRGRVL